MKQRLQKEREFFDKHIAEWRSTHLGEFVLIKDEQVVGFYSSLTQACDEGIKRFGLKDFFVEQILPADVTNISFIGKAA